MRWFHWDVETFHRLKRLKNGQMVIMEKQEDASYKLVSPIGITGDPPSGLKQIALNPVARKQRKKRKVPI